MVDKNIKKKILKNMFKEIPCSNYKIIDKPKKVNIIFKVTFNEWIRLLFNRYNLHNLCNKIELEKPVGIRFKIKVDYKISLFNYKLDLGWSYKI